MHGSRRGIHCTEEPGSLLLPGRRDIGAIMDKLLAVISNNLDDALDITDRSDNNSDVRIDCAKDIIEQARCAGR